jgi:multisubunit Na+/H+ antiporter MnhE subunit
MTDSNGTGSWRRSAVYLLIWWVVLYGVWFLLVDSLAHPEVAVGPFAALLAAFVALGIRRVGAVRYRFRGRWLKALLRVPAGVLRDTAMLAVALWRRLVLRERPRSAFRVVAFEDSGTGDAAESAAWRAYCTVVTSLTPNTYVVGIDGDHGVILVHQLAPDDPVRLRRSVTGAAAPAGAPRESA